MLSSSLAFSHTQSEQKRGNSELLTKIIESGIKTVLLNILCGQIIGPNTG